MKNVEQITVKKKAVRIDCYLCTNCGMCYNVCKKHAISRVSNYSCDKCIKYCTSMDVPCKPVRFCIDDAICDLCGDCISACMVNAIRVVDIDDEE